MSDSLGPQVRHPTDGVAATRPGRAGGNPGYPASRAALPPSERGWSAEEQRAVVQLLSVVPLADDLGRRFEAAGHRLYLVGGPVRDAFLGRPGADLDFTTDARPEQVKALVVGWAEAIWETGIEFGTVGIARGGHRIEVTTFRTERYDPGSRNPSVAYGSTLAEDLVRRDFTVNAMALSVPGHEFFDPHGGLRDLATGVLRTPGRPEDSFADDPLRMLRAARFAAQLGLVVEPAVVAAMTSMADRIGIVSVERVRDELTKMLLGQRPRDGIELLVATGLAELVIPEVPAMRMATDPQHRHKDVYAHSLTVLEQAIGHERSGPDLVLRWAALLHDVGKPRTREFEPGGGVSFHHHEVVGRDMARRRLTTLRYDKQTVAEVARLVELHLRFHGYGTGEWTDAAVRRYVRDAGPLLERLHALVRSDCTTRNRRRAQALRQAYDNLEARIARLAEEEELASIRPDLDGVQVMAILGLKPGRDVGAALSHLLELRMERGPLPPDEAESELRAWWAMRQAGAAG